MTIHEMKMVIRKYASKNNLKIISIETATEEAIKAGFCWVHAKLENKQEIHFLKQNNNLNHRQINKYTMTLDNKKILKKDWQ